MNMSSDSVPQILPKQPLAVWDWLVVRKDLIDRVQSQGKFTRSVAQRVVWLAEFSELRRRSDRAEWFLAVSRLTHDQDLLSELVALTKASLQQEGEGYGAPEA